MSTLFQSLPPPKVASRATRLKTLTPAEQIAQHLGRAILSGEYPNGSRILEQDVAGQFSVSRGPVRDALRELHKQGLVDITPRRGTFAAGVVLDDVIDMFNIRGALLALAVRYVALQKERAPLEHAESMLQDLQHLHALENPPLAEFIKAVGRIARRLVHACGSRQLALTYRNLPHDTIWHMLWVTDQPLDYTTPERRDAVVTDFTNLFQHMRASDADSAERLMRKINTDSCREVMRRMTAAGAAPVDMDRLDATAPGAGIRAGVS